MSVNDRDGIDACANRIELKKRAVNLLASCEHDQK